MVDLYHNCHSCHYFDRKTGKCLHEDTFVAEVETWQLFEDGTVEGIIKECFDSKFNGLKSILEMYLSKKRAKEVMELFYEELEEKQDEWAEMLDSALMRVIGNQEISEDTVRPSAPQSFYCKYFM